MNNILFINKPAGMTSFDVCFKLRKILNTKKIGHTGTLDPNASGVMIILYDKATKANQFLVSDYKTYFTEVLFGINTDTLDTDGHVIEKADINKCTKEDIENVLNSFLGNSKQEVPLTSAIKINGKKLYEYQRQNIDVELPIRDINITDIKLNDIYSDGFSFTCTVSSGTYIRSLVRDICKKLGNIGVVKTLVRTAIDDISIDMCDELEDVLNNNYQSHNLYELFKNRYTCIEYDNVSDIYNGKAIKLNCDEDEVAIINNGEVLAVYKKDKDVYRSLRGLF